MLSASIDAHKTIYYVDYAENWNSACPACANSKLQLLGDLNELLLWTGSPDYPVDHGRYPISKVSWRDPVRGNQTAPLWPLPGCSSCANRRMQDLEHKIGSHAAELKTERENYSLDNYSSRYSSVEIDKFRGATTNYLGPFGIGTEPVRQVTTLEGLSFYAAILYSETVDSIQVAGGKGNTEEQAYASCLGELIERYYLTGVYAEPNVVCTVHDLSGAKTNFVPPAAFGLLRDPKLARYGLDTRIGWTKAIELTNCDKEVFIPSDLVYSPPIIAEGAAAIYYGSTNGTACGASLFDATLQALLELVERDAFWYYMRRRFRPIRINEVDLPERVLELTKQNRHLNFIFTLLRTPFEVPVIQVVSTDSDTGIQARGTGAHFSLHDAIDRAFNECCQMHTSLLTAQDVHESSEHMRQLWYTGQADDVFPNIFNPQIGHYDISSFVPVFDSDPITFLLDKFTIQGMGVYLKVLHRDSDCCVVKCIANGVHIVDSDSLAGVDRLSFYSTLLDEKPKGNDYSGSVYM